ncbi:MAG: stage III sporulation protein AF [Anaerovoracaceae bacterium]|jgi:stage III sporulation protein AF
MVGVVEWVRNIFIMVAAISFIELILPEGGMGRYLKFIFSLMILGAIIYPFGSLLDIF